jgi:hypothetical protein
LATCEAESGRKPSGSEKCCPAGRKNCSVASSSNQGRKQRPLMKLDRRRMEISAVVRSPLLAGLPLLLLLLLGLGLQLLGAAEDEGDEEAEDDEEGALALGLPPLDTRGLVGSILGRS